MGWVRCERLAGDSLRGGSDLMSFSITVLKLDGFEVDSESFDVKIPVLSQGTMGNTRIMECFQGIKMKSLS